MTTHAQAHRVASRRVAQSFKPVRSTMFYSDVILSKRGPLAKVWLAAHAERRLSKSQLLHTDIEETVSSIIDQDGMPMALRLSGQLLLGVARIYSRQAKYLLDDCNEALLRLKTVFRSGALDSTDLAPGLRQAVTLPVTRTVYDLSLPDPAYEGWDASSSAAGSEGRRQPSGRYTARPADITLQRYLQPGQGSSSPGWTSGDFFDPDGTLGTPAPVAPEVQRHDSQGRLVDANGDPIEEADETFSSIGVGRDAQSQRAGRHSLLPGGDMTGFDDFGADDFPMPDISGGSIAGGLDLGLERFEAERQRSATPARHTSSLMQDLTPRTAHKVQQAAEKRAAMAKASRRVRKQIVDPHTELDDGTPGRRPRNADGLVLASNEYLPASHSHLELLELHANPARGLLPFLRADASKNEQTFAAAQGLAPQLRELFTFDASMLRRRPLSTFDHEEGQEPAQKRLRAEGEDDDDLEIEIGRRAEQGSQHDLTLGGEAAEVTFDDFGDDGGMPMFDLGGMDADTTAQPAAGPQGLRRSTRKRLTDVSQVDEQEERRQRAFHELGDLERLSTPSERSVAREELDPSPSSSYPLRAFDYVPPSSSSLSGSEAGGASDMARTQASASLGLSKNAVRAVHVLRRELTPASVEASSSGQQTTRRQTAAAAAAEHEDGGMSFQAVTRNASRRAAAGFFFEMLALGTKDCIDVQQDESYGDIRIRAKPGLWELERAMRV